MGDHAVRCCKNHAGQAIGEAIRRRGRSGACRHQQRADFV